MADKQIGELTAAGALDGTELIHVVQGGNSRQSTTGDIAGLVGDDGTIYDFGASFETVPDQGAVFGRVPIMRSITIPDGFTGSFGDGDTNPDAEVVIDVQDDGVTAFTITVSAAGAVTFDDGNSPTQDVEIAAGSVVTFVFPTDSPAEATMAGWAFGIAARVA
jgi:hypothetical protein